MWTGAQTNQSLDGDSGHGDMECHLAGGEKEPELVWEVEWYWLEIVGLTSETPNSLREAGLSSTLELPTVRGGELVWACL